MANINNVTVKSDEGTLLSNGAGTYDPMGLVLQCTGYWNSPPSIKSIYTINFSSDDSYGQPLSNCSCTAVYVDPSTNEGTGTFSTAG